MSHYQQSYQNYWILTRYREHMLSPSPYPRWRQCAYDFEATYGNRLLVAAPERDWWSLLVIDEHGGRHRIRRTGTFRELCRWIDEELDVALMEMSL